MKLLHTGTFVLTAEVDALNMIEARALWLCSSRPATLTNPETHLAPHSDSSPPNDPACVRPPCRALGEAALPAGPAPVQPSPCAISAGCLPGEGDRGSHAVPHHGFPLAEYEQRGLRE